MIGKFSNSNLDMFVLAEIAKQPIHGYGLIRGFKKTLGVYYGPSTIYPMLTEFESKGWITSEWKIGEYPAKPQKIYSITTEGRNQLRERCLTFKTMVATFNKSIENLI